MKWLNDVLFDGGKFVGVLVEFESGLCEVLVVIGSLSAFWFFERLSNL